MPHFDRWSNKTKTKKINGYYKQKPKLKLDKQTEFLKRYYKVSKPRSTTKVAKPLGSEVRLVKGILGKRRLKYQNISA